MTSAEKCGEKVVVLCVVMGKGVATSSCRLELYLGVPLAGSQAPG